MSLPDIRYALRTLARSPGLSTIAILSLAVSISANSAIFSVINAVILRSLPVRHPDQLVSIALQSPDARIDGLSVAMLREIERKQRVFSAIFGADAGGLANIEAPNRAWAAGLEVVTGTYFTTLGVQPALGRLIGPEDAPLGSLDPAPVAVLSDSCWHTRFGGDPNVVGTPIRVEGVPLTIVGVAAKGFAGLTIDAGFDVAVPFHYSRRARLDPRNDWVPVLARLKDGISLQQARAQLEALWPGVRDATAREEGQRIGGTNDSAVRISVSPAGRGISFLRERFAQPLVVVSGLVGLTLVIACVNLASMMLARVAAQGRENAIRLALGAPVSRLIRQGLTESLLLSLIGGAIGFATAGWISNLLLRFIWRGYVGSAIDVSPDYRVAGFTFVVAVAAGCLFGLLPAWRASREDPLQVLQRTARVVGARLGRFGRVLVAAQIGLSLVLLVAAALFLRSLQNLRNGDAGFRRDHILIATPFQRPGGYRDLDKAVYYREINRRIRELPGVRDVSFSNLAPLMLYEYKESVAPLETPSQPVQPVTDMIGPGFFSLMGMRIRAGREFQWSDDMSTPNVAIVSESFARRVFPNENALGKHIRLGSDPAQQDMEIIGVVNSASLWLIRTNEPMAVYTPILQSPHLQLLGPHVDVLTAVEPSSLASSVRHVIESMGHDRLLRIETLQTRTDWLLTKDRLIALLATFFGSVVLLLAAIGVYGLISYAVTRRTAEIGIRMAVGASSRSVVALVLKEVVLLVGIGIVVGLPVALAASRLIASMLFGVSASDLGSLVASSVVLFGIAMMAGYLPARRASRLDPNAALRVE